MNTLAISNMTLEEKLATMEQIWDDICLHQNVQAPAWHGDVLQIRAENRLAGRELAMDWQDAKLAIRQQTQ